MRSVPNKLIAVAVLAMFLMMPMSVMLTPTSSIAVETNKDASVFLDYRVSGDDAIVNGFTKESKDSLSMGNNLLYDTLTIPDKIEMGGVEKNVISIDYYAFGNCTALKSIVLPDGLEKIDSCAFKGCSSLQTISIPDSVTTINGLAFDDCSELREIRVGNNNMKYSSADGMLFNKDGTELIQCPMGKIGTITLPNTVTKIPDRAFCGCSGLTGTLSIPEGVTQIPESTFQNCTGLTSITIPVNVVTIGKNAFHGCSGLISIEIPKGVDSIGTSAFGSCDKLLTIDVDGENKNYSSDEGVLFNKDESTLLQYPAAKSGAYSVPTSVSSIESCAFKDCSNLESIVIPEGIKTIKSETFCGCVNLKKATFPVSTLASIEQRAFYNTGLTAVTLPDSVTSVGVNAFGNCKSLTSIAGCSSEYFTSVDGVLFAHTSHGGYLVKQYPAGMNATSYEIPSSILSVTVTGIDKFAFSGCSRLKNVTIPDSIIRIDESAFIGCYGLESIVIPKNVETLVYNAFKGCTALEAIDVVEDNGNYSSDNGVLFNKLKTNLMQFPEGKVGAYVIPGTVTMIMETAFENCNKLSSVTVPDNIKKDVEKMFRYCSDLEEIIIGADNPNYSSIDGVLFNKGGAELMLCPSGKTGEYLMPVGVKRIYALAFNDCKLNSIKFDADVDTISTRSFINVEFYNNDKATIITDYNELVGKTYLVFNSNDGVHKYADTSGPNEPVKVSFISGGERYETQTIWSGAKVTRPIDPAMSGYFFTGWFTNGVLWNFDNPVTYDIVLTAKFSIINDGAVIIDAKNVDSVEIGYVESVKKVTVVFNDAKMIIDTTKLKDKDEKLIVSIRMHDNTDKYDVVALLGNNPYNEEITIVLIYDVFKGEPTVYYYPETGPKIKMDSTIDEEAGTITFTTNHNSVYGMEYGQTAIGHDNTNYALLIVLIVTIIAVAYVGLRNRDRE